MRFAAFITPQKTECYASLPVISHDDDLVPLEANDTGAHLVRVWTIGPRSTINRKLKKKKDDAARELFAIKSMRTKMEYGPKTDQYARNDLSKAFNPIRMSKKWWVLIHQTREVE